MSRVLMFQDSSAYDVGYNIGYIIGRWFPVIIIAVVLFFIIRYFIKKSKK